MLRDITIGQHFPGNSLVHRFDPRLKLVLTIAYIVLLFAASNPLGLTLSILFLGVMYKVAKIPVKMIGKSLKPILPIVLFTAVLNLFFVSGEGDPLVHFWFLSIYAEGVRYAVLMAVRVMALIAGTSLLTYTTSPIVLTDAIEQLLKPLIEYWTKAKLSVEQSAEAVLSTPVVSGLKYQEFVRVRLGYVGDKLIASPLNRGSGVISSFMKADGILEIPQSQEGYEAGDRVPIKLLRREEELRHTLVAIGSHDPMLDELANMLHLNYPECYMSSSHVGSMGGIMAVRRNEAHLAGIHLLDEADGSYNVSFLKRYFPQGGVRLLECVGRTQGLMVAAGNPLGLTGFADIAREGLRYVNRQKGSGTRILADYLCKQQQIDPSTIYGYEREEFTHTAVAAQIATGSADAGMGIWSAAKMYQLDFIPVCIEQYDLLVPDQAWESPLLQHLLEILASGEFRRKLEELGGYEIGDPGRVRLKL